MSREKVKLSGVTRWRAAKNAVCRTSKCEMSRKKVNLSGVCAQKCAQQRKNRRRTPDRFGILRDILKIHVDTKHPKPCATSRLQKKLIDIRKLPHFDTRFEPKNCPSRDMCSLSKNAPTLLPAQIEIALFCVGLLRV